MANKKKTINVATVIAHINDILRNGISSTEFRLSSMKTAEFILHSTGNFRGYRYLLQNEVPAGQLPGIVITDGSFENTSLDVAFSPEHRDSTRIHYFI